LRPQQERSRAALAKIVQAAEKNPEKRRHRWFLDGGGTQRRPICLSVTSIAASRARTSSFKRSSMIVTSRIEMAVAARLSQQHFSDNPYSRSSTLSGPQANLRQRWKLSTGSCVDSRTQNPVLNQIGLSGRHRIFAAYREALLPFLDGVPKSRAELLVRVSFHLLAAAIVGKARVDDGALADLSWNVLESEIGTAAIAYLETGIRAGAKPIRPTRIRTSGTRKAR